MSQSQSDINIYWANLCILNRMEGEKMEASAQSWLAEGSESRPEPKMIYLGDTEEVGMYDKVAGDLRKNELGFDLLVSTRFDIFCSKGYLLGQKENLFPLKTHFSYRPEIEALGVCDPFGLYHPLVVLPHFIVANTKLLGNEAPPASLKELLEPRWAGQVFLGATELPSAKSVLFALWYLYGSDALETAAANWRQKSAPSAARHGLVKDEFPIALLPGIFGGPGPEEKLVMVEPKEGCPVLPSYAAIRRSSIAEETLDFLKASAARKEFADFYRERAFAYPTAPDSPLPANLNGPVHLLFPPWEWILEQDFDYFEEMCASLPMI